MSFVVSAIAGTSVRVNVIGGNIVFVVEQVLSLLRCSRVVTHPFLLYLYSVVAKTECLRRVSSWVVQVPRRVHDPEGNANA